MFDNTTVTMYFVLFVLFLTIYGWLRWNYGYWKRKKVLGPEPIFIFGNVFDLITRRKSLSDTFSDLYSSNRKYPFVGLYTMLSKQLMINDPDLIKAILLKDFDHFHDRGIEINESHDPLMKHLFNLNGQVWKNLRAKLTPTFTSSKMKYMFSTLKGCNQEMISFIDDNVSKQNKAFEVNTKELFACLNTDIIGSCAFGIDCNSFKYPDAEFRTMGRNLVSPGVRVSIQRMLVVFAPGFLKMLGLGFMDKKETEYFYNIVDTTIKTRQRENIVRNDFLQLLIDLQDDNQDAANSNESHPDDGTHLTTMQIAAQVLVFFIAGFETSSTVASFALYELALNPDIQSKLREEIDEVTERHNGDVTYEALGEMTYLSLIVEETLRKYPPVPVLFRICNKDYTIPDSDNITIEKGTRVVIPIHGIHRDPDIYPDPLKFDPERFTPENKATRHHFAYMPFGEGPRICIGNRFGLMQTKLGLVSILSKYEVSPCERTLIPMKYDSKSFILSATGGVWLKLTPRSTS